ncbi:Hypothetical protein SMAX5B_017564 [Scophthalmus maximus]|uniref:Uncharacterized protein n=1 Tax=Scophthalmus maximus TaxID=52904 RepID=A0A2U9CUF4_SCOMX|nr:Hypothetical protein SMAX5B_017564 [Scophthalmus maximus]
MTPAMVKWRVEKVNEMGNSGSGEVGGDGKKQELGYPGQHLFNLLPSRTNPSAIKTLKGPIFDARPGQPNLLFTVCLFTVLSQSKAASAMEKLSPCSLTTQNSSVTDVCGSLQGGRSWTQLT